jgi:hypothetical protein
MRALSYSHWIGVLASIIGIVTPVIILFKEPKNEMLFAYAITTSVVIFILCENLYLKKYWRKKKKYPEIFNILNGAFAYLNQLPNTDMADKALIKNLFIQSCTKMAEAFSKITDTSCSVALKVIHGDFRTKGYEKTAIDTFVRDSTSLGVRDKTVYQSPMVIEENTDFKEICNNIKNGHKDVRHYFSNNLILDALKGYKNSRFGREFYDYIKKNSKSNGYRVVKKIWNLQYKSTIVVAIYPFDPDHEHELTGFLCIDSPRTNVFSKYDLQILYGIADTLFNYRNYIKAYYEEESNLKIVLKRNSHAEPA